MWAGLILPQSKRLVDCVMGFNVKRWYVGRRRRRVPTDLPVLVWMNSRPLEKWKSVYPTFCVRKAGHFTFDSLKINTKTKKHKLSKGYFCSCIFLCDQCCLVSKNIFYIPCDGLFKLFWIWRFSCPCLHLCFTFSFLGPSRLVYTTYICRLSAVYPPSANCQVLLELADALW